MLARARWCAAASRSPARIGLPLPNPPRARRRTPRATDDGATGDASSSFVGERVRALAAAASAAERAARLEARAEALRAHALACVKEGDEAAARDALEVKARVLRAAAASRRRSNANAALAAKLAEAAGLDAAAAAPEQGRRRGGV
jgi:hypothetical protein